MYPRLCKPGTNLPRIPPPFISHPGNENLQLELPIESHSPLCQVYRRFPCTKHLATILSKTQVAVERTRGCSPSMTNFSLTIFLNDFFKRNALFMTQVLVEWLMDQVPLGNKTPRPGLPRLVHCPACRGLLPYPQALDSGHVLLECFAIEGTKPELASVFLKTIQVQEFVKESEPSLRTAEDWARARRQPTPSLSRDWIQVEPRCQSETT